MYEQLLKTVTNLGSPRVLVVGDFMLDVYIYGDAMRISPEAPVPVLRVRETTYGCGGAGSVAADLAVLGAVPICLGIIGDDKEGRNLKSKLDEFGADTTGLIAISDRPTISKQRLIGLAQHRHQQQLFRMDVESTEPLTDRQYEQLLNIYRKELPRSDMVCLQDYNKGLLLPRVCKDLIKLANEAGKMVLVDPSISSNYEKYNSATLITPNRHEASSAVGFEIQTISDAERAAEQLKVNLNLKAVVITLDKEGAYLKTDDVSEHIPTSPRNVYDVTGAGDMVLATLAITLAAGCDHVTAVQLANITGGIEVGKFGVATVSIEEIINEIVSRNKGTGGKLRDIESLLHELAWQRTQKNTIVFTNGCFDVLHRGHTEFLKFCKSQGDILVVGLNSDSSVRGIKGPERPINNEKDRSAVLAALEAVDYVTLFEEPDPLNLIKAVKPNILVKGQDWADKGVVGADVVESYGGRVVLAPLVEGKSSTLVIEKIKTLATKITHMKKKGN